MRRHTETKPNRQIKTCHLPVSCMRWAPAARTSTNTDRPASKHQSTSSSLGLQLALACVCDSNERRDSCRAKVRVWMTTRSRCQFLVCRARWPACRVLGLSLAKALRRRSMLDTRVHCLLLVATLLLRLPACLVLLQLSQTTQTTRVCEYVLSKCTSRSIDRLIGSKSAHMRATRCSLVRPPAGDRSIAHGAPRATARARV